MDWVYELFEWTFQVTGWKLFLCNLYTGLIFLIWIACFFGLIINSNEMNDLPDIKITIITFGLLIFMPIILLLLGGVVGKLIMI